MDAVKSFFAKYQGVASDDAGVKWDQATDESLIGWLTGELGLLRRGDGDPHRKILKECLAEAWQRIGRLSAECGRQPADWPGRNTVGRLLAALATHADLLTVSVR